MRGGKTATSIDNQWIKKKGAIQGQGKDGGNSWVKLWMGCEGSDGEEQRGDRAVVALMSISFGFGVLSVLRLCHAQVER